LSIFVNILFAEQSIPLLVSGLQPLLALLDSEYAIIQQLALESLIQITLDGKCPDCTVFVNCCRSFLTGEKVVMLIYNINEINQ